MDKNLKDPFLYFNYVNNSGEFTPLQFTKPIRVLIAQTISEVIPFMEIIQQAVNDGYYAAGYLAYEAAPAFDPELEVNIDNQMPLLWFGIFNEPVMKQIESTNIPYMNKWKPTVTIEDYNKNINKIHSYIKDGLTKQVNYTIHFESEFKGDPLGFYKQLEHAQSANYSAYMDINDFTILSASPELFFRLENGKITTKPMKGTVGRGKTYEDDIKNAEWLKNSKKNRKENQLVVDLMRSELGKIAIDKTIDVPSLYDIEKYPTVYQMTSTVTATIRPEVTMIDIFKTLFPSGSITGMPKKDTMKIITELEKSPREVYCGAIGFITPDNEAVFNVPIRTVLIDKRNGNAKYGVGGAITKDSTKEDEYEEVLIKSRLLTKKHQEFELLETIGLINGEYIVLKNHLDRLNESALYFNFKLDLDAIYNALMAISKKHTKLKWKVRLVVNKNGKFSIKTEKVIHIESKLKVELSEKPVRKDDLFLYHKTTNRKTYEIHQGFHNDTFDVLLWNENDEITEFTMGNIVVRLNGKLFTPPIECGLLAGTYRRFLLDNGKISEKIIMVHELEHCEEIWFINSVREWVPVELIYI